MRPVPVANPPNRFSSTEVEYLEELVGADAESATPFAGLEVFEDHTRKILATNDSPDLGFRWSVNPYRGCMHACAYCIGGETPILMADGSAKQLDSVRVGDAIYGTVRRGRHRRYVKTLVLAAWSTIKSAYRITLEDGTELVASGDHRFLTHRGWRFVAPTTADAPRLHLSLEDELVGVGRFASAPTEDDDYRRGYVQGMAGRRSVVDPSELPVIELEDLLRLKRFVDGERGAIHEILVGAAGAGFRTSTAPAPIAWPCEPSASWRKGFLAGLFDAAGSYRRGLLRFSITEPETLRAARSSLEHLGFDVAASEVLPVVEGGIREHMRFFHTVDPAVRRKRAVEGRSVKCGARLRVVNIKRLSRPMRLYDITTGTGDFIANGVVSHNCYARPGHEYLSFGAGTDFDRKIVIKPDAPALLREAFEHRSWKGEFLMFSGVTDCYQPLEASYRLTRGCLEVCAEYKNPLGIVTKAPLIERDIDVLQELQRVTRVGVTISVPFWNPDKARAIEPYVATPQRRIRTIERLAKAGLRVGVNVAPLIPGLGDEDMAAILAAAREAGAVRANCIFVRLPGSVKQVFEERLRTALPLRAEKVLARIREARGGKLNDPRFGSRQRGEGNYADAIQALFESTAKRLGLETGCSSFDHGDESTFERPGVAPKGKRQLPLF